jgi:hypothetical protein
MGSKVKAADDEYRNAESKYYQDRERDYIGIVGVGNGDVGERERSMVASDEVENTTSCGEQARNLVSIDLSR